MRAPRQKNYSELNIFSSAENAFILAEWLSVTIPHRQSPISLRLPMLLVIFSVSHFPLNVTSRMAWTKKGIHYFNPTNKNPTIPL